MRLSKKHEIQCLQQGILQLISRFSASQEVSAGVHGMLRAPLWSSLEEWALPEEVDGCRGWRSWASCRDAAWAAALGSTTLNGGLLGPLGKDGRVINCWGYLDSWPSCAHPSFWLRCVERGQYSERIGRAGVLPPTSGFSGNELPGSHGVPQAWKP